MNMCKSISLAGLVALAGCGLQTGNTYLGEALWNPEVIGAADGIYIQMPYIGGLIRVKEDGTVTQVDLKGANPSRMIRNPDGSKLLVFSQWAQCKDDAEEIVLVSDCDQDDLVYNSELEIIENGQASHFIPIAPHLNAVEFSAQSQIAVAYRDDSAQDFIVDGLADLGEVMFIDTSTGEVKGRVSVGFTPSRILFGPNNQVVVMSRSKVVAVDLETFDKILEAPLTLDADQEVDPSGAELAYDADSGSTTLLLTVKGSSDLYMLDLQTEFWNIGDLGAIPTSIGVDNSSSKSVFVFDSSSKVVVLDHGSLATLNSNSLDSIQLEEPSNKSILGLGFALLYNDANSYVHDVYRLDLETNDLTEYVLENPLSQLDLSDSGRYAVGIMQPETYGSGYADNNWGISVLDMASDDVVNLVAESRPIGVELVEDENNSYALVLMEGVEFVLKMNLADPLGASKIDLPAPPVAIGSMQTAEGHFVISHDVDFGMISTLDPQTETLTTISGFGAVNILSENKLPRRAQEE